LGVEIVVGPIGRMHDRELLGALTANHVGDFPNSNLLSRMRQKVARDRNLATHGNFPRPSLAILNLENAGRRRILLWRHHDQFPREFLPGFLRIADWTGNSGSNGAAVGSASRNESADQGMTNDEARMTK